MPASRFRLLVVDDDASARNALDGFLTELGYDCHTAADGKAALDAHDARAFDLILSDWTMPGCDGMELCTAVRARDGQERYTYFVLMTARPSRRHLVAGLRHGADDFITKPIDLDELEARCSSRLVRPPVTFDSCHVEARQMQGLWTMKTSLGLVLVLAATGCVSAAKYDDALAESQRLREKVGAEARVN
jgi:DNA-binding response OmpR family regulator